jgi:hypothetical protein
VTRRHRRWHAGLWLLLGPLLVAGFVVGVRARPAPIHEPARLVGPEGTEHTTPLPREVVP